MTVDHLITLGILASLSAAELETYFVTGTPTAQLQGRTHMAMRDLVIEHSQWIEIVWISDMAVRKHHQGVLVLTIDTAGQAPGMRGHLIVMIGQNGFHWKGHILSSIKVGGM